MHLETISNKTIENNYFFVRPSQRVLIDPSLTTNVNETHVSVKANNAMANYVWIRRKNNAILNFEDNFFDLVKGEEKIIENSGKATIDDLIVTSYQN